MVSPSNLQELEHLRGRVRLYVQVLLAIDILGYASDVIGPLFYQDLAASTESLTVRLLRWSATVLLVGTWSIAKFARPRRGALIALESGITLVLVFVYIKLGSLYFFGEDRFGPAVSLSGVALLLVVRAALVPSPVTRTAIIGASSVAGLLVTSYGSPETFDRWGFDAVLFMGVAFVVATSVTSHVIYGLRAQVRDAMRLGQYELGRKLGQGGMGEVYEATHMMLRRATAVKLLPPDKVGHPTIARFEREVRQTSRLEHPNSVRIYDYGRTPDGQFYYAMEYIDGMTLEELVEMEGPINVARVAFLLRQAARALAEAHAMGLVHRDIKPANIMLCDRAQMPDTVKVLDFGLVKVLDDPDVDRNISQANTVVGTPHYLSPEAVTTPDEVGAPSDVYALGAVGFFLLTGRDLFPGKTVIEVCSQHLSSPPDAPSDVRGDAIDPAFAALILRCLEKNPRDRPPDGAALAEELEALDLSGWTPEDARNWWQKASRERTRPGEFHPRERTQLAIDVGGRT